VYDLEADGPMMDYHFNNSRDVKKFRRRWRSRLGEKPSPIQFVHFKGVPWDGNYGKKSPVAVVRDKYMGALVEPIY
jgi:hypothetical protein